jgi:hypothetical protein
MTKTVIIGNMKTHTVRDIIDSIGPREALAAECGVAPIAVYRWRQNGSIPAKHFAGVLRVASKTNPALTAEALVVAHDLVSPSLPGCGSDDGSLPADTVGHDANAGQGVANHTAQKDRA